MMHNKTLLGQLLATYEQPWVAQWLRMNSKPVFHTTVLESTPSTDGLHDSGQATIEMTL